MIEEWKGEKKGGELEDDDDDSQMSALTPSVGTSHQPPVSG